MVKDRSYETTGRKKHKFGRGSRWCKRCGDYTEVAISLGFKKNR